MTCVHLVGTGSPMLKIADNRKARKYSKSELLKRVLWSLTGRLLFHYSPRMAFGWRRLLLRLFGAKVGGQVHIYNSAIIYFPWNLEIEDWSSIGEWALIYNLGPIWIGKSVTISQRVHLCAGTHNYHDPAMPLLKPPIVIENQTWICADAFVGPGVVVHEGAIVGARAVVMKDVNPWTVVIGNPGRVLKKRKKE